MPENKMQVNVRKIVVDLPENIYGAFDEIISMDLVKFRSYDELILRVIQDSLDQGLLKVILDITQGLKAGKVRS